jgi:hypothetical protein
MIARMKLKIRRLALLIALSASLLMPVSAARAADEDKGPTEARLENYPSKVTLEDSSTATSWLLFIVLAGLTVLVMFKNANRTHLD